MNNQEKELDALTQKWACMQKSYISYLPAECGHHYIGRSNKLLRWDLRNIIPLTYKEHTDVHNGSLFIDIKNPFRLQYLQNMKNKNFKDYLLEHNLSVQEFMNIKYMELKKAIDNKI